MIAPDAEAISDESPLSRQREEEEKAGTVVRPPSAPLPVPEGMPLAPARPRRRTYLIAAVTSAAVLLVAGGVILALLLLTSSKVTVPDLEGLDVEEAEELVSRAGLSLKVEAELAHPGAEEGEVLSQTPAAGQKLEKGSVVRVDVCGKKTATGKGDGQAEDLEKQLEERLVGWKIAWERRDINSYLSYYAPDFYCAYNPKMSNYTLMSQYKAELFRTYSWIQLELTGVQIILESDSIAQTAFMQRFTCSDPRANDYGHKVLKWKNVNGQWLIYNEEWRKV